MALTYIYNSDTPQGGQQINNTLSPINGNFQEIDTLMAVNHVAFNTVNDFGKHKFVSYVNQGSDPSTTVAEIALYSKAVQDSSNLSELFYRYPNDGTVVQLTGSSTSAESVTVGATYESGTNPSGYKYLAGSYQYLSSGLIFMTGNIQLPASSVYNAEIPVGDGIPVFSSAPLNIVVSAGDDRSGPNRYGVTIVDSTQFTIKQQNANNQNIYWIAIGV